MLDTSSLPAASKTSPEISFSLMPWALRFTARTSAPSRRISCTTAPSLTPPTHRLPVTGSMAMPAQLWMFTPAGSAISAICAPVVGSTSAIWLLWCCSTNRCPLAASYSPPVRYWLAHGSSSRASTAPVPGLIATTVGGAL